MFSLEGQKVCLQKNDKAFFIKKNEDFFSVKTGAFFIKKKWSFFSVKTGSGFRIWDEMNSDPELGTEIIRVPLCCRCNGTAECVDESDEDGCEVCGKETWTCSDNRVSLLTCCSKIYRGQMGNRRSDKWILALFENIFVPSSDDKLTKKQAKKSRMEAVCYGTFFFAGPSFSSFICSLFIAKFSEWKVLLLVTVFKSAFLLGYLGSSSRC